MSSQARAWRRSRRSATGRAARTVCGSVFAGYAGRSVDRAQSEAELLPGPEQFLAASRRQRESPPHRAGHGLLECRRHGRETVTDALARSASPSETSSSALAASSFYRRTKVSTPWSEDCADFMSDECGSP